MQDAANRGYYPIFTKLFYQDYHSFMFTRVVRIWVGLVSISGLITILSCAPLEEEPAPVEEEGIYINEIYAAGEDWIELYNSLDISKDISGYFIYDNEALKYKIPTGTTIPAKGFLVLICNDLGTGLNTNFKLTSDGETVYLENTTGTLIDRVEFPAIGAGQSYGRFPDGSANLAISGTQTQGVTNGGNQVPAIVSTAREPIVPGLNQTVVIKATVVSAQTLTEVKLYHRFNGASFTAITMSLQNGFYVATLPAQSTTGNVDYYLEAIAVDGQKSYEPATAPNKVLNYLLNTDPLPNLVINEFMAYNTTCCPDKDSGTDEFDDWIEIFNAGSQPVNLTGMYVSDNRFNPFKYKIPEDVAGNSIVEPGEFLIIWADNSPDQGPLHADFGLSNAGEDVGVYYIDGRKIDEYTFGAQSANVSWGRTTNGAATWKAFSTPTPGASNQ